MVEIQRSAAPVRVLSRNGRLRRLVTASGVLFAAALVGCSGSQHADPAAVTANPAAVTADPAPAPATPSPATQKSGLSLPTVGASTPTSVTPAPGPPAKSDAGKGASDSDPLVPDFKLSRYGGGILTLKQARGKIVLLDFWATWCGPCRDELPKIQTLYEKYKDKGFVVYGVAEDSPEGSVLAFMQSNKITFPVARAAEDTASIYGTTGLPATILIGRDGKALIGMIGEPEDVLSHWEPLIQKALAGEKIPRDTGA